MNEQESSRSDYDDHTLALVFCSMLEDEKVIPITYNDTTATLLYQPEGKVFSPNQWREIANEEIVRVYKDAQRRLKNEPKTSTEDLPEEQSSGASD